MTKEEKCSATQKGRVCIHLGNEEKRVYKDELDLFLNCGWELVFSKEHSKNNGKSHIGKSSWNKGKSPSEETRKKLSESLKGRETWNKGMKYSEEELEHMKDSFRKTMIDRYGKTSIVKGTKHTEEHKRKIGDSNRGKPKRKLSEQQLLIKLSKEYITKKKNNSFNTSSSELELYKKLCEENKTKTIYRNYKCERYPFYCDFYIKEDDLFIELNAHWTHGGKPFDEKDADCIRQLNEWKEKAKTSKFYEEAIKTWTVRDVNKRIVAEKNKLNYKVIY